MKARIGIVSAILLGLAAAPVLAGDLAQQPAAAAPVEIMRLATDLGLPDDNYILNAQEGDVTGDGVADKVYLTGRKQQASDRYANELHIVVVSGSDQTITVMSLGKEGGYQGNLFLGDFTGDHVADVYAEIASGGSGGWSYRNIITFSSGEAGEIFGIKDNQGTGITGRYLDNWQVALKNNASGKTVTMDVSDRRQDYLRMGIYDESGRVLKEVNTMSGPFGKLDPVDEDKDGVWELKGQQRISGAYRADGLADVETLLKYADGAWQVKSVKFIINMDIIP